MSQTNSPGDQSSNPQSASISEIESYFRDLETRELTPEEVEIGLVTLAWMEAEVMARKKRYASRAAISAKTK